MSTTENTEITHIAEKKITLKWLNQCLTDYRGESTVVERLIKDIGTGSGFAGSVLRVTLTYDVPSEAPANIIVKLPVKEGELLEMMKAQNMLLRESLFYRDMAAKLSITTPQIYYVEVESEDFAIVM